MKNLLSSIAVALGVTFAAPFAVAGGDTAKGEPLTIICSACHGADGNSAMATFPKLAGLGEKYLLKQLKNIKSGERPIVEMTGLLDNMSEAQLADIAAFYNSKTTQLSGSKNFKVLVNSGVEVDALPMGTKLYRAGNKEAGIPACSGCHSPRGLGNGPAGYPRLSGQHPDYIVKQLQDFRAGRRVNDEAKVMRGIAERMSDAEMTAVANFIAGLN